VKKFREFVDRYLVFPVCLISLPMLIGGAAFQTEMFTLVSLGSCGLNTLIGLALGVWFMHYIVSLITTDNMGKKLREGDVAKMLRSLVLSDVLLMLMLWFAGNIPAFKLGVCGIAFCFAALAYYFIWKKVYEKKRAE